ncbi:MAG: hypothetical protein IJ735_01825 [Clostridia bacterium]|nr:hypothetical protein [Clostridia bacterium]
MNVADYIRKKNAESKNPPNKNTDPSTPQELLNKYSGYNEEQLMAELFRYGSLSSGNVSAKELDDFYQRATPFLSPEQAERMKELILRLKNS